MRPETGICSASVPCLPPYILPPLLSLRRDNVIRFQDLLFISLLAICFPIATSAAEAPAITWGSDPVRPNETVLLMGGGLDSGGAELGRIRDTASLETSKGVDATAKRWQSILPLQASPLCAKFVVPAEWMLGIYACRFRSGSAVSNTILLNSPDPWWMLGDQGETASPGGWLRIFGKCLSLDKERPSAVVLATGSGARLPLHPRAAGVYTLRVDLPKDLAPGEYDVAVHNGFGGGVAWREAGRLIVRPRRIWKSDVFNVKDFGADSGKALLAAMKKAAANGGGIVYLPRGRYPVQDCLVVPNNTVLKGESTELVTSTGPISKDHRQTCSPA